MGAKQITLQAAGLYTYPNNLSEVPPGGLLAANNTIIDKPGVIEPRRGIKYYGSLFTIGTDRAKQLLHYRQRLITHIGTTLAFDDGEGVFTNFNGSFSSASNYRMKSATSRGNLYLTTDKGVYKISAKDATEFSSEANYIKEAGICFPIDPTLALNFSVTGFLNAGLQVGYKVLFGYKDANNNENIGSPSSAVIITNNSSTPNAAVSVSFKLPEEINSSEYYFRIYRTQPATVASDVYRLVFQGNLTSSDISLGEIIYTDKLADESWYSGIPLYTNTTDEGPLTANDPPPFAKDIAVYNSHTFFSDTRQQHQALFSILNVSGFTSGVSNIVFTDGTNTSTYTYAGLAETSRITAIAGASIPDRSFIKLYGGNDYTKVAIWFDRTGTSLPPSSSEVNGFFLVKIDAITGTPTANTIAARIKTALDTSYSSEFTTTVSTNIVTIVNVKAGSATNIANSTASPTGMTVQTIVEGFGENASTKQVLLSTNSNVAAAADETAKSLVRVINAQSSEFFTATYLPSGSPDIISGNILIRKKDYSETPIYIGSTDLNTVSSYSPEINKIFVNTVSTGNPCTITTLSNHNLISKSTVLVYGASTSLTINGLQKITVTDVDEFQIPVNVTSVTSGGFTITTSFVSTNYAFGNRLYYSKFNQPEAVPFANFFDIGSKDNPIQRIVALRESLFIFKKDGIFRLTGDSSTNFTVSLFDNTNIIVAPDTASVLDNQIYVFTTQGVIKISEVGFDVISIPIKEKFIPFITSNPSIDQIAFSVPYQTDRAYLIWTVSSRQDTYATVCYRYSLSTQSWTEWKEPKTCAVVLNGQDKLYFGSAIKNTLEVERKNFDRFDYADREIASSLIAGRLTGNSIRPTSFEEIEVEDVISQTQYVTIYQYNSLLRKLDLDFSVMVKDFLSSLEMRAGDNLTEKMIELAAKLNVVDTNPFVDSNGNTSYVFTVTSNFEEIQTQFNEIVDRLNESPTFSFINYQRSEGTVFFEAIVTSLDTIFKVVELSITPQFMQGNLVIYKGIKTVIEYSPQTAGDSVQLKQFYQGTWMFAYRSFYTAQVGYTSDLSLAYENVPFFPSSSGVFGQFSWGDGAIWGGTGDRVQLRTYIPRDKQRARFLTCRLQHGVALESYESYGVSISYNDNSDRAYR
jgi:hypothetical protein